MRCVGLTALLLNAVLLCGSIVLAFDYPRPCSQTSCGAGKCVWEDCDEPLECEGGLCKFTNCRNARCAGMCTGRAPFPVLPPRTHPTLRVASVCGTSAHPFTSPLAHPPYRRDVPFSQLAQPVVQRRRLPLP